MTEHPSQRPADAVPGNWVDDHAPLATRPYLRLIRADRPVGVWLLLWPCWWSIAMAEDLTTPSTIWMMVLFALGAFVMRSAGCIINDLWDRDIDAQVERTAGRPLASGAISTTAAVGVLGLMGSIGLLVLLQLNGKAVILGLASVPLVLLYPLAKRVTWWPQLVLGLVFNWGALLGWTAVSDQWPGPSSILLYVGCLAWTIGYDTIYAHQDKEDDALVGVKSSALKLGNRTKPALLFFYGTALVLWALAGRSAGMSVLFFAILSLAAMHFVWQIRTLDIDNPGRCLKLFKSNIHFGWIIFAAIALGTGNL
jgi:4-hydroxybenzoate polyprenyltransferase